MNQSNKKVLFILPHYDFRDKEYTWIIERLDQAGISHEVASNHLSEAQGRFGTIVKPDVLVNYLSSADYDAYIFVGEEASREYVDNPEISRIIINALSVHKVIAAIGYAVSILGFSGILAGRRVTGPEELQTEIENTGAFYTGRLIEQDGDILTANGPYAVRELAESIIKALEWSDEENIKGKPYLR
jgi:putative intracellular protease/amidase